MRSMQRRTNARDCQGFVEVSPNVACANLLYESVVGLVQRAQGMASELLDLLESIDGRMLRILELVVALDFAEAGEGCAGPGMAAGSALQVRKLDLFTPGGQFLAQQVSFDLVKGVPLLVTGPNGSGKSLLFLTLLGLVPPAGAEACITVDSMPLATRPGLALVMASPQRVYLPLGTLGNQVTYPRAHVAGEEAELREVLRAVGLQHILEREPRGWEALRIWEDVLSGGEQQRMGLARVFYTRPRFALLDECTSMVASDAEEGLYKAIFAKGVTPLTLSQRLFMPALYKLELSLGAPNPEGWSLTSTRCEPAYDGCGQG